MQFQSRLLTAAIVSALAASATVHAAAAAVQATPQRLAAAASRAQSLLNGPAAASVHRAGADAFVARDTIVDANGTEHVRLERTYHGLPVIGGDFVLHTRNGQAQAVSQTLKTIARPSLVPTLSRDAAIVEAGNQFGPDFAGLPTARLVVYARNVAPVLAYEVSFSGTRKDQTPTDMHYFVDASTGRILDHYDTIETALPGPDQRGCTAPTPAVGTGKTLLLGDETINIVKCGLQYQMVDTTRGGGRTTNMGMTTLGMGTLVTGSSNIFGTNLNNTPNTVAADANVGVAATWDYYKNIHGRNGIANDGRGALSRVHFGVFYANAFWNDGCFCMTFGDGDGGTLNPLVALDVAGHEMSHGVMARTANLTYSGESGGLNEANSDIFGTMVEFYVNSSQNPPNYMIGEKVYKDNPDGTKALRYMFKPSLDKKSPDCYSADIGNLDVHYSSGVANHFYYLVAEGAVVPNGFGAGTWANLTPASLVCNGDTSITGIGRDKAERIWYRAITTYMTSGTNYAGARAATLSAAADLYGNGSPTYNTVAAAWSAVNVN